VPMGISRSREETAVCFPNRFVTPLSLIGIPFEPELDICAPPR
jgi:hypothetical protein